MVTQAEQTPRRAAVLLSDALNCLDKLEPESAREPVRQMFRAGIELCTIKRDLLGEEMNYMLWLAQVLVDEETFS